VIPFPGQPGVYTAQSSQIQLLPMQLQQLNPLDPQFNSAYLGGQHQAAFQYHGLNAAQVPFTTENDQKIQ